MKLFLPLARDEVFQFCRVRGSHRSFGGTDRSSIREPTSCTSHTVLEFLKFIFFRFINSIFNNYKVSNKEAKCDFIKTKKKKVFLFENKTNNNNLELKIEFF